MHIIRTQKRTQNPLNAHRRTQTPLKAHTRVYERKQSLANTYKNAGTHRAVTMCIIYDVYHIRIILGNTNL